VNLLAIAWRNLRRNPHRSLTTILSIAIGFSAVALFSGYTRQVYAGLQEQAVHGELLGHLTLVNHGMRTEGRLHPERYLLRPEEISRLAGIIRRRFPDALVAPRLGLSGLASNGRISTIFLAEGVAPADMLVLRGASWGGTAALDQATPQGVVLAAGLADLLGLRQGDDASLLVSTLHGQANAADAAVLGSYHTGSAGLEDKALFLPLAMAQSLYDAPDQADRLTVLLPGPERSDQARRLLAEDCKAAGLEVDIDTWRDLSAFYRQVKGMMDLIFGFILCIVLAIVVMSITSAMRMSVIERTREIGTLRAIGLRRAGVVRLFSTEALLLAGLGCLGGLAATLAVRALVNAARISYTPPNGSNPVLLDVGLDGWRWLATMALLVALSLLAAVAPSRRAARRPVTESLAHV